MLTSANFSLITGSLLVSLLLMYVFDTLVKELGKTNLQLSIEVLIESTRIARNFFEAVKRKAANTRILL